MQALAPISTQLRAQTRQRGVRRHVASKTALLAMSEPWTFSKSLGANNLHAYPFRYEIIRLKRIFCAMRDLDGKPLQIRQRDHDLICRWMRRHRRRYPRG